MWACSRTTFLIKSFWHQLICTKKGLNYYFISWKTSTSGGRSPPDPLLFLCFSKIEQFSEIKYSISICSWMWVIELVLEPCKLLFYFKCLPQICTTMKWFQVRFFFIFWGGAHRAPSPNPFPLPGFFSGFALGSGFAFNSQALRAFDSGFALDSRALRTLDSGFALNFRLENLVWPPQNKFLDPPLRLSLQKFNIVSVQHKRGIVNGNPDALSRLLTNNNEVKEIVK